MKGGLEYFETRTEFWRQQRPLYARRVDRQRLNNARKKDDPRPQTSQSEIVLKKLKEIDDALTKGDVEKTLRIGLKLLKTVGKLMFKTIHCIGSSNQKHLQLLSNRNVLWYFQVLLRSYGEIFIFCFQK